MACSNVVVIGYKYKSKNYIKENRNRPKFGFGFRFGAEDNNLNCFGRQVAFSAEY